VPIDHVFLRSRIGGDTESERRGERALTRLLSSRAAPRAFAACSQYATPSREIGFLFLLEIAIQDGLSSPKAKKSREAELPLNCRAPPSVVPVV
jgi:hypothetical protein